MRKYSGFEVDFDGREWKCLGFAQFVSFGIMDEGTMCYHKIVDGEEDESCWYSCFKKYGKKFFVLEAVD